MPAFSRLTGSPGTTTTGVSKATIPLAAHAHRAGRSWPRRVEISQPQRGRMGAGCCELPRLVMVCVPQVWLPLTYQPTASWPSAFGGTCARVFLRDATLPVRPR